MTLESSAFPLAYFSGLISVLSPCVWPLVPIVLASAATGGKRAMLALALGLSIAFGIAGSLLSFLLVSTNTDPEFFRYVSAALLIVVALPLISHRIADRLSIYLGRLTGRFNVAGNASQGVLSQFGVGLLLGLVWLPCVGPTLGAAIALASMGQQLAFAFAVMLCYGLGTATVLVAAALLANVSLGKLGTSVLNKADNAKRVLGYTLLLLGILVLTGLDKLVEAWAVQWLPTWLSAF